jgi:hypothetical protein
MLPGPHIIANEAYHQEPGLTLPEALHAEGRTAHGLCSGDRAVFTARVHHLEDHEDSRSARPAWPV